MSSDTLEPVREALNTGDKKAAQALLKPMLKDQPSASTWYLAAQACTTDKKAVYCLHQALDLQPQHSAANRMLLELGGAAQPSLQALAPFADEQPSLELLSADIPLKRRKRRKRLTRTRILVLLCVLLFGTSISLITMNLAGLITGPITVVTQLTGGPTPVSEIGGKPLSQVDNAVMFVQPSLSKELEGRDADVLEPGYAHQYTFGGARGGAVAIYIQFLSVAAKRVSRNVALLRPDDSDGTSLCEKDTILQGDNNITLTCTLDANGIWKVRILGRAQESVGAYFVGVEPIVN